ncbi:TetR/AcrR family transcriptional regulator [Faecalibaculum rodentium]|uniref:TetR/AcrR family transcriptional regulator n=1 Tax=Faecalibaculum rodentium TaxID=1702221 RepID=UPI0023F51E68|nr:TetR/AcrR family transcriptional regulator [Faecalibaculum rodentium]
MKKQLTQALEKLLKAKPLETLSVQELCETAMVGRASIYRNFTSKEDILKQRIQDLLKDWILSLSDSDDRTLSSRLLNLFRLLDCHRDFCGLLHERNLVWLLRESLNDCFRIDASFPRE